MSKTRLELITQALVNLGIIATGQTIAAEDVQKMDTIIDPAMAELNDLEIYYVSDAGDAGPSGGDFADSAFLSLAAYVANAACAAFNLPSDAKMKALAFEAESKLITLNAPAAALSRLKVDPALARRRPIYRGTT